MKHEKTWEVRFYVHLHVHVDVTVVIEVDVYVHMYFSIFKLVVVFERKNSPTLKQCLSYLLIRVSSTEDDVAEPLDAGSTYVGNT